MMLPTPLPPLPKNWKPLAENVPAAPFVAVRPLLTISLLSTPLVVTPSGDAFPVPPTKLTVAPKLRTRVVIVTVDPQAPATGGPAQPELLTTEPQAGAGASIV